MKIDNFDARYDAVIHSSFLIISIHSIVPSIVLFVFHSPTYIIRRCIQSLNIGKYVVCYCCRYLNFILTLWANLVKASNWIQIRSSQCLMETLATSLTVSFGTSSRKISLRLTSTVAEGTSMYRTATLSTTSIISVLTARLRTTRGSTDTSNKCFRPKKT